MLTRAALFCTVIVSLLVVLSSPTSPTHAQQFGRTPITPDNAATLTLMAYYNPLMTPLLAPSSDGRWLAMAYNIGNGHGPGGDTDPLPYQRPLDYFGATVILLFDMEAVVAAPQVLYRELSGRVDQIVFTDESLLVLASPTVHVTTTSLLEWRIVDSQVSGPDTLIEAIDGPFAANAASIVYVYAGDAYLLDRASGERTLFDAANITPEAPVFEQNALVNALPLSLRRHIQVADDPMIETAGEIVDYAYNPDGNLVAAIIDIDGTTHLTLWDASTSGAE